MNQEGEVLALAQMPANPADAKSYAVSAAYAQSLATNALSASDSDYRDILIRKALPADPTQAHSFIFLLGTRDTATYATRADLVRLCQWAAGWRTDICQPRCNESPRANQ